MLTAPENSPTDIDQRARVLLEGLTGMNLEDAPTAVRTGLLDRAGRPGFTRWLDHAARARGCTNPVRLRGNVTTIEADTGRVLNTFTTDDLPDRVLYKPCGTRLASRCPSCAETYRWDCYQLIRAGLAGGKGVPETVSNHPAIFLTLTAPSFGTVHSRIVRNGRQLPCRARRDKPTCPHGRPMWCLAKHEEDSTALGRPFCLDCYDYPASVVFNYCVAKLWDRTMLLIRRALGAGGDNPLRLRFVKVAEYQRRGVIHLHALLRLDGYDPDRPELILPPPTVLAPDGTAVPLYTGEDLKKVTEEVAAKVAIRTPAHPIRPDGWVLSWGTQNLAKVVRTGVSDGELTERHVAGYLAKYATKSTESAGFSSARLDEESIAAYADQTRHHHRLIAACWDIGSDPDWFGLKKSAHKLGFAGHFHTKSRRYSTTMGALRDARRPSNRVRVTAAEPVAYGAEVDPIGEETTLVIATWQHVGNGWRTVGDAALAAMAADAARQRRPLGTTQNAN